MMPQRDKCISIEEIVDQLIVITERLSTIVDVRTVSIDPSSKLINFVINANNWRLSDRIFDHGVTSGAYLDSRTNTYKGFIKFK